MVFEKTDRDMNGVFYRMICECAVDWKSGMIFKLPFYRK
jgi:hypothetical protein